MMITVPQILLMRFSVRGVIKLPASDTISARLINHRQEAEITPNKKCSDCAWFIVALNAPKSIVPSITACALNHVTTHACHTVLPSGICCAPPICRTLLFNRLMPIYTTTSPPINNIAICTAAYFCIISPMPKKHAMARVMSKKMTISAVKSARQRGCVSALLITNRFCMPIGAT